MTTANLTALAYLVSGVLFIMALRGLSSPATSRQGNLYGMVGMAIAILTTLALAAPSDLVSWALIIGGLAIGGGIRRVLCEGRRRGQRDRRYAQRQQRVTEDGMIENGAIHRPPFGLARQPVGFLVVRAMDNLRGKGWRRLSVAPNFLCEIG